MPKGIVARPRLASLALVAALAASSHVALASATATPRRALLQDTVAERVESISQTVADVADTTAQAVVEVAKRVAEEAEASFAPAPAPEARRRSLLQSETSVLTRLEREIAKAQKKLAKDLRKAAKEAMAPESMDSDDEDDDVDAEAPEPYETRRRSLLSYETEDYVGYVDAPAPAPTAEVVEDAYASMPALLAVPPVAEPGLEKRRRALLQAEYVDYVDEDDEDDIAPTGSPVDDLAPAPAPA